MNWSKWRTAAACLALCWAAGYAHGWGHEAHRLIAQKACEAMPEPLRAFFIENQEKIVQRAIDPYLWRESDDPKYKDEHANHYFDIDYEGFGPYPFNELPRNYEEAVEKFGDELFDRYGRLPWRIVAYLDVAEKAFQSGDADQITAALGAHAFYAAKPYQPYHCVMNFNGRKTGQPHADALWEWNLVQRYEAELASAPAPMIDAEAAVEKPYDAVFEAIMDSYALHFLLLNHDRRARSGLTGNLEKNDEYFRRLWAMSGETLQAQISKAAKAAARFWLTAWERAGKPELPLPAPSETCAAPRLRDYGIQLGVMPTGPLNAITDVAGVKVGHVTVNFGEGENAARTGVTAIVPRDDVWNRKVAAATFNINGNGAMTGAHWVNESGWLETPILLTGTLNVPRVANGVVSWMAKHYPKMGRWDDVVLPFVTECNDAGMTDAQARYVTEEHTIQAIESAKSGHVEEGSVGAGTGMRAYSFKAGIGTASRVTDDGYTLGALVLANGGRRHEFRVDGVPVGRMISDLMPKRGPTEGSFVIVLATDAPLTSRQLKRICKRAAFGLARTGAIGSHGSGDFVAAFSTAVEIPHFPEEPTYMRPVFADSHLTSLFRAAVEATEEAIVNAVAAGKTMTGRNGRIIYGIPLQRLLAIMNQRVRVEGEG